MKKLVVIIALLVMCIGLMTACDTNKGVEIDPIEPKELSEYIDETALYFANSFVGVDYSKEIAYDYAFDVALNNRNGVKYEYAVVVRGNAEKGAGEGIINVIDKTNNAVIIEVYFDGDNVFVKIGKDKVKYENVPVSDLIIKFFGMDSDEERKSYFVDVFTNMASELFLDGYASEKGDKYYFTSTIATIMHNDIVSNLMGIMTSNMRDMLLGILSYESYDALIDDIGSEKMNVEYSIANDKITDISFGNDSGTFGINITNMYIQNGHIKLNKHVISSVYPSRKLGDNSFVGKINLTSQSGVIATYDIEINSYMDIAYLIAHDYDFTSLDEDNYFHLRISHQCTSDCGKYCEMKYLQPNGSVLELAFSPRYFGTNMLYFIMSPKAIFNENAINALDSEVVQDYLLRVIADYQLIAINSDDVLSVPISKSRMSIRERVDTIVDVFRAIDVTMTSNVYKASIDYARLMALIGLNDNMMASIKCMLGDDKTSAETLDVSLNRTEFSEYDIKDFAINIIDRYNANTKEYVSIVDTAASPALSWNYYDVDNDGDTIVNNLYDEAGGKIYGVDTPISMRELDDINAGYIKYSYMSYRDELIGADGSVYAKILDILGIEKIAGSDYSKVTLKVRYPSIWSGLLNDYLYGIVDKYLYDIITINVKFDEVHSVGVELEGKSEYYFGENVPSNLLSGIATINYAGRSKVIKVEGKCDTIGQLQNSGIHIVEFDVFGEKIKKEIRVRDRENNIGSYISINLREIPNEVYKDNGVWHMKVIQQRNVSESKLFDGFHINIEHSSVLKSTRNIDKSEIYYEQAGTKHYFDEDFDGVWASNNRGTISFTKVGTYKIATTANGLVGEESFIILHVVEDADAENSKYKVVDETVYRDHYFESAVSVFTFRIYNVYHGNVGKDNQKVTFGLMRGYSNDNGVLKFENVDATMSDYIDITSIEIKGVEYTFNEGVPFVKLPSSIREPAIIRVSVKFKAVGYYKVSTLVGSMRRISQTIYVEPYIAPTK